MLTGEHKIGTLGSKVDFRLPDLTSITDDQDDRVYLDNDELRSLYALLSEHFNDGWIPCGTDGPFPADGAAIDCTLVGPDNEPVLLDGIHADSAMFRGEGWYKMTAWRPAMQPYRPKEAP